jgi:hypothetical protein
VTYALSRYPELLSLQLGEDIEEDVKEADELFCQLNLVLQKWISPLRALKCTGATHGDVGRTLREPSSDGLLNV